RSHYQRHNGCIGQFNVRPGTLAFVTISTFILLSTTSTLCLLFLPKLHAILKRADNCDPVIQSMGLKIECNTRRFLTDDRRELQYRVEIQNKVYRREVAALDLEIGRLERQLLEINSVSCSSSTSSITTMPRKMDMYSVEEGNVNHQQQQQYQHPRTPSIGGGLPLLLLSVLPPVIPRASWPSAVQELPMRRSVTFSSEPKLDEQHNKQRSQT
ncbi:metabotropic GABA-B receptor subtype 3, partial [Carabus blaptoides fortunei]